MDRPQLLALFQKMAGEVAEKDLAGLQEASVIADIGVDSLAMLEIIGEMERELGVQIPDDELVGIETVSQLLNLVEKARRSRLTNKGGRMASDQFHEKLYQRFRTFFDDAEENRRWNPYRDVPWDKINPDLPDHVALCAETFLGVESYLPDYIRFGLDAVRVSSLGQRWFAANWGYEELKHSLVLTEYLLRSGKRTEEQMFDFQAKLMEQVWERPFESARQMTIYGVFQEMATFVIYLRHEKVAQRYNDEALATAYRFAARDEVAHARFYEDVTKVCLEEDREGTLRDINLVVKRFEMPGVDLVPDYDARIEVMRQEGAVDRDLFYKKVFFPTLRRLGVDRSELGAAARREREERRGAEAAQ